MAARPEVDHAVADLATVRTLLHGRGSARALVSHFTT